MTVTPEGFRYRGQIFPTVNGLFRWFKDHYQDPVPGDPPDPRGRSPACSQHVPGKRVALWRQGNSLAPFPIDGAGLGRWKWMCGVCWQPAETRALQQAVPYI